MRDRTAVERPGRAATAIVLGIAALVRLAHFAAVRDAPFVAQLALDSQEYDRWARAIAGGDWLGSEPFFQAPLYPYLVALVYRAVGAAPAAVYLLQIALALAGCWALIRAGARLGGRRLALAAGLLFALYQPFWFYDVQLLKESLAVDLAAALLALLLAARADDRKTAWLAAGLAAGLLALLRENLLLALPFLLPLAWRRGEPASRGVARLALLLAGLALPLLPVAARNAALGGGLLPTTSQGGVNFYIGNHPGADGTYRPLVVGKQIPSYERAEARRLAEQASGRALSAGEVSRYWLGRSLAWVRAEPGAWLALQARKLALYWSWYEWPDAVDYYWMKQRSAPLGLPGLEFGAVALLAAWGLLLERRRLARWAPVLLFELGWMLSVVAFFLFARYRLPALPGLLLLAAVPLAVSLERWRSGARRTALAGGLAIALVVAAPHFAGFRPRGDLVEFNLGRLAAERGDRSAAALHYRAALAADPRHFSATLELGNLAAREGAYELARDLFRRAVELAPDSDDAHANLGGALLALGDPDGARRELARALELNPENRFALHNRRLLPPLATSP